MANSDASSSDKLAIMVATPLTWKITASYKPKVTLSSSTVCLSMKQRSMLNQRL